MNHKKRQHTLQTIRLLLATAATAMRAYTPCANGAAKRRTDMDDAGGLNKQVSDAIRKTSRENPKRGTHPLLLLFQQQSTPHFASVLYVGANGELFAGGLL